MKLEAGQKIRVTRHEGEKKTKENLKTRIGTIVAKNERHVTVQFKNYRESFCIADFEQYKIEVRVDKQWIQLKIK